MGMCCLFILSGTDLCTILDEEDASIIHSETHSTDCQHVKFTTIDAPELHACISHMAQRQVPLTCWGGGEWYACMHHGKEFQTIYSM